MLRFPILLVFTIKKSKAKQCPFAFWIWKIHVCPMGIYMLHAYV